MGCRSRYQRGLQRGCLQSEVLPLLALSDDDGEAGLTEHPWPEGVGFIAQPEDTALLIERVLVFDRLAFIVDPGSVGFEAAPG